MPYAKWVETTVTYTVNFETFDGSTVSAQEIPEGGTVTEPAAPEKDGFTFNGWYWDSDCKNAWNFANTVYGNITLYAKWIETVIIYTVNFETFNGSTVDSQQIPEGGTVTEPAAPEKDGYRFGGWYDAGLTAMWNPTTPVTDNMTLYAKWYSADNDDVQDLGDFGTGAVVNQVFNVAATSEWNTALAVISGGGEYKNYVINITANFQIEGAGVRYGEFEGLQISIRGERKISMSADGSKGSVLSIYESQAIVVRDVDFVGMTDNNTSLIYIYTGKLTLRGSASVSGNGNSNYFGGGGGVYVRDGSFTMQDNASVSGNIADSGGGVLIYNGSFTMRYNASVSGNIANSGGGVKVNGGSFTMRDNASLSGNTATTGWGGGVNASAGIDDTGIDTGAEIRIEGGIIYGNASGDDSNSAPVGNGASLFMNNGCTLEYGTFDGETWIRAEDGGFIRTDDTIHVINGVLQ